MKVGWFYSLKGARGMLVLMDLVLALLQFLLERLEQAALFTYLEQMGRVAENWSLLVSTRLSFVRYRQAW